MWNNLMTQPCDFKRIVGVISVKLFTLVKFSVFVGFHIVSNGWCACRERCVPVSDTLVTLMVMVLLYHFV